MTQNEPRSKGWNADVVIVVAITDRNVEKQAYGISLFLVDTNLPGFKRGKLLKKIGMHTQDKISIIISINFSHLSTTRLVTNINPRINT